MICNSYHNKVNLSIHKKRLLIKKKISSNAKEKWTKAGLVHRKRYMKHDLAGRKENGEMTVNWYFVPIRTMHLLLI